MKRILICGALALLSASAVADDLPDGCSEVLKYSARDYSLETSDIGVAVGVYDNYCENDSVKSGTSFNAGLDTVIKAVPTKFNLGYGSTEERTNFFCKTFDLDYKRNEKYYRQTSQVVRQTTNAWLQCKSLASQGLVFRPQVSKTMVLIEIGRRYADAAVVQGVQYDDKLLTCNVPNSDSSKKPERASMNTVKTLEPGSWTVTCIRSAQNTAEETIFPAVDITVGTNRGPFLLPVAADAKYPYQWASDLQRQMRSADDALLEKISALSSLVDMIKSRGKVLAIVNVKGTKLVSSSAGVSYDSSTGVVTFPNPESMPFVPVVSSYGNGVIYSTETHFLRSDFTAPNQFKVWRSPLDTSNRNSAPDSFTAVAIGF